MNKESGLMSTENMQIYKTLTVSTKSDNYLKGLSRPKSTTRHESAHRKNIFSTRVEHSKDERG